ncbi:MAG: glutamine--fructose-6-phosphate transaminase (isomerizing) [Candidatus Omnitrophica bacterium]|nr:glutamine--fructose-6-phosphate transaminase (isomerizing) [Candidatus Omnitrophota bacterium]
MCGIVGYVGRYNAKGILMNGLKKLEYRGYDSAGIAIISHRALVIRRCKGKISCLEERVLKEYIEGNVGVGHTRWATHGRPSEGNAHPHSDCASRLVVVHNGIIENYLQLKKRLLAGGHVFKSETDTEVIAHLVEQYLKPMKKKDLLKAVQLSIKQLKGSYAIAVISLDDPHTLVAARHFSPLIVGLGRDEYFVASDIPAILDRTKTVIPVQDNEIVHLTSLGAHFYDHNLRKITRKPMTIDWDPVTAEKGGYKHFMLKEIFEQPMTIQETIRGRFSLESGDLIFDENNLSKTAMKGIRKIYFVACGTAYHAGMVGKYLVEDIAKIPCEVDLASEFRYRKPLLDKETLIIAITQSGETADTLAALREAKRHGARTLAICNVTGSSATRDADGVVYTRTGPEIGVASTKAFTAQLAIICALAIYFAHVRAIITKKRTIELMESLYRLPRLVKKVLALEPAVKAVAQKYFKQRDFLYLGRNVNYPIALEGALKLKEISYIHAEGYAAGEMKHGPIALIDEQMPVVVLATGGVVYDKVLSNIQEIKARGGMVLALATEGDHHIKKIGVDDLIYMPQVAEVLSTITNTVVLQLFAYHVANLRGCDVDQPRNLAKSVVVE